MSTQCLVNCVQDAFFKDNTVDFQIQKFPNLKPPHVFSRKFGVVDSSLQASMMRFQADAIHTCLTHIVDKDLRRTAVRVFKSIQSIMGDRPSAASAGALTHEVRLLISAMLSMSLKARSLCREQSLLAQSAASLPLFVQSSRCVFLLVLAVTHTHTHYQARSMCPNCVLELCNVPMRCVFTLATTATL